MIVRSKQKKGDWHLSDRQLDELAEEINGIDRKGGFDMECRKGKLILERCYGGSVERLRSHSRYKNDSIRRLAERGDCGSRATLNRAVAVYLAVQRMPWVLKTKRLTASHVFNVCSLRSHDKQVEFLQRAEREKLNAKDLQELVVAYRREMGENRGAPRATQGRKANKQADRCLAGVGTLKELLRADYISDFRSEELEQLATTVEELYRLSSQLKGQLHLLRQEHAGSSRSRKEQPPPARPGKAKEQQPPPARPAKAKEQTDQARPAKEEQKQTPPARPNKEKQTAPVRPAKEKQTPQAARSRKEQTPQARPAKAREEQPPPARPAKAKEEQTDQARPAKEEQTVPAAHSRKRQTAPARRAKGKGKRMAAE